MDSENSPTACCGRCSIETATDVSALIAFVLEIIFAAYFIFFFPGFMLTGLFAVPCAFTYLLVIYAQNERRPRFFMPCLIIDAIRLILSAVLFAIPLLVCAISPTQERVNALKNITWLRLTIESRPFIIANFIAWCLSTALICWLYFIIVRGYIALRNGLRSGRLFRTLR